MAKNNYDKYYKEAAKNLETSKKEELTSIQNAYNTVVSRAEKDKRKLRSAADGTAGSAIERNSVKKMLTEKMVDERLANLGLASSGYADSLKTGINTEEKRSDAAVLNSLADKNREADREFNERVEDAQIQKESDTEKVNEKYDEEAKRQAEEQVKADKEEEKAMLAALNAFEEAERKRIAEEEKALAKAEKEKQKAEEEKKKAREKAKAEKDAQKKEADQKLKAESNEDYDVMSIKIRRFKSSGKTLTENQKAYYYGLIKSFVDKYGSTKYALKESELERLCDYLGVTADDYREYINPNKQSNSPANLKVLAMPKPYFSTLQNDYRNGVGLWQ